MTWFASGETITVHSKTGANRYGDYTYDEVGREVHGCALAPRSSREDSDRRDTVIIGLTLFAPADATITATDMVTLASGSRWHVDGEPGRWRDPFLGWAAGLEVALTRVDG